MKHVGGMGYRMRILGGRRSPLGFDDELLMGASSTRHDPMNGSMKDLSSSLVKRGQPPYDV